MVAMFPIRRTGVIGGQRCASDVTPSTHSTAKWWIWCWSVAVSIRRQRGLLGGMAGNVCYGNGFD